MTIIKEIPLPGWFVKRGGKAAVTQHSLIFADTTMIPVGSDVPALLTRPPVFANISSLGEEK